MDAGLSLKTIKQLIGQTPLIIDPDRDGNRFQEALASLPTEKLQSFYRNLSGDDRRRFHYVANICLGFESWSRLYQELVVHETQTRLTDRIEEAYAHREEELRHREEEMEAERDTFGKDLMRLEGENHALRRENVHLLEELTKLRQTHQSLQRQQQQLLNLVERYKRLIEDLKRFMPKANAHQPPGSEPVV